MDGSINFSGTLAGSIADSGGRIQDVQTNASGNYETVVDEQGIAKIDLTNYATNEELESVVDNINSVLLTKLNKVNFSTEEQNTGVKWIDGKDIYFKTFVISPITMSTGTWYATGCIIPNIDRLIYVMCSGGGDTSYGSITGDYSKNNINLINFRIAIVDTIIAFYTKSEV